MLRPTPTRTILLVVAALAGCLLTTSSNLLAAKPKRLDPPPGGAAFITEPNPEANPWASKGIASKYVFGAYYTRKNTDAKWNTVSRTDEYADIMVRFADSDDELVFWRGDHYLPYWQTAKGKWSFERLAKQSDAQGKDHVNRNTHATIIESSPKRVVIHWRYMTDWPEDVGVDNLPDQTRCADEYFIITPDRTVTRAFRPGCEHVEHWGDPSRVKVSRSGLADDGIKPLQTTDADRKAALDVMGFAAEAKHTVKPGRGAKAPASPCRRAELVVRRRQGPDYHRGRDRLEVRGPGPRRAVAGGRFGLLADLRRLHQPGRTPGRQGT